MGIDGFQENTSAKDASAEIDMKDNDPSDDRCEKEPEEGKPGATREAEAPDDQADDDSHMLDRESDNDSDMDDYDREDRREYDSDKKKHRKGRALGDAVFCRPLEVIVRDDRVEQAIRQLKNRMAREGVLRELKNRRHYFKPSELKRIKSREAARRRRKQIRQKIG
jgi:small subunit ribosomal protein S21